MPPIQPTLCFFGRETPSHCKRSNRVQPGPPTNLQHLGRKFVAISMLVRSGLRSWPQYLPIDMSHATYMARFAYRNPTLVVTDNVSAAISELQNPLSNQYRLPTSHLCPRIRPLSSVLHGAGNSSFSSSGIPHPLLVSTLLLVSCLLETVSHAKWFS